MEGYAKKVNAPFEVVPSVPETPLGIRGVHQRINASLAVGLAKSFLSTRGQSYPESLPPSFIEPLESTRWPGRCQRVEKGSATWLLDGAHTTESLRSCGNWAWSEGKPNVLVFNCSGGRAAESLLGSLLEAGSQTSGLSKEELGQTFDTVIFCTNVTYVSGAFKGGECRPLLPNTSRATLTPARRPIFERYRPERSVSTCDTERSEGGVAEADSWVRPEASTRRGFNRACREHHQRPGEA